MFEFRKHASAVLAASIVCSLAFATPDTTARSVDSSIQIQQRLARGEVVVDLQTIGDTKFVVGKVIINHTPDQVWPIMTNPFEYENKICPRMKNVHILSDKYHDSLMSVKVDCGVFLPEVNYVVESHYEPNSRIDFKRVSGTIRDFKGAWVMRPTEDNKTEITYSMYIDPGFFVPQWIMREGVKVELPKTLLSLRRRVNAVCNMSETPEKRSILAATYKQMSAAVSKPN
jgi:ribosome-associated toxin RatA of RatAB toxin-antitoxin module